MNPETQIKIMPYIPEEHKKYGLLPHCVEKGREVFDYPSKLIDEIESYYSDDISFIPYGYNSYEDYFNFIEKFKDETSDEKHRKLFDELPYNAWEEDKGIKGNRVL